MRSFIILSILILGSLTANGQTAYNINPGSAYFISESVPDMTQTFSSENGRLRFVKTYYYYRADSTYTSDSVFSIVSENSSTFEVKIWEFDSMEDAIANYVTDTAIVESPSDSIHHISHPLNADKLYLMEFSTFLGGIPIIDVSAKRPERFSNTWRKIGCAGCLTGFNPEEGVYILSAWVMDLNVDLGTVAYKKPYITVTSGVTVIDCIPSGEIIDGWQRIEKEVIVEEDGEVNIQLVCGEGGNCLFDDIRFFPKDGSMITYVYDPITLRLMAELDERNYAKIYEYDEQGKLIRVKKETEMGIMTIQENRENNSKE